MVRVLALLLALSWLVPTAALAQDPALARAAAAIAGAEGDLKAVDGSLNDRLDADERAALRTRASAAGDAAQAAATGLEAQLALVDARVAGLGAAAPGEATDIRRQRAALAAERATVDAAAKRGRLAAVEARQLVDEIDRSRAEQFNQTVSTRVASPVTPAFWTAVLAAAPRDLRRVTAFATQGLREVDRRRRADTPWAAISGGALAILIGWPLRRAAGTIARRRLIENVAGGPDRHRLRRSAFAVLRVLIGTLSPLLAAVALATGLRWSGLVPPRWGDLADAAVTACGFAGFTVAVTGAVLMRGQPAWRQAPLDDETARRLRPLTWVLAGLSAAAILLDAFNAAVGASRAAATAAQAAEALATLALLAATLLVVGRLRAARADAADDEPSGARAGVAAALLFAWGLAGAALVALLAGFVGLGAFLVQLVAWATVLACALYLVVRAADDLLTGVFRRDSPFGRAVTRGLGVRGSAVDQFGLVAAGVVRLVLLAAGLGLLFTPFGAGGGLGSLLGRLGALAGGVEVGGVSVSPGAILRGFAVLAAGLFLVRSFTGWLDNRYLPVTELDGSGRNSVILVARYVGIALAVIWSLASLGIGVERIALLLSALSVGIGFGLQAITQNFVSGLILLAERPIRIGDLVRVGQDEGDVKRISVRSTEIELADHSTLIVPNSELITKSVLNKTRAGPLGRLQIQFSVPLEADVRQVRRIVMDVFAAEEAVLVDPAPVAFIDGLADGRVLFNCFAHVASPRVAYPTRSAVLLDLLGRLHDAGVDVGTPPQRLEFVAPDG